MQVRHSSVPIMTALMLDLSLPAPWHMRSQQCNNDPVALHAQKILWMLPDSGSCNAVEKS